MRRWWILGLLGAGGLLMATSWNATYEAIPNGATDLASDLDTLIKSFKVEVRQRLEVEHEYGGSTEDNGLHTIGSARVFVSAAAPTDINSGTAARGQYNSAAGSDGGTALTTTEVNGTADIGTGRMWIDTDGADNVGGTLDDQSLYVWNEIDDQFEPVVVAMTTNGLPQLGSFIYNNSFEITDGTGNTSSTTVPAGWSVVGVTPTFAYPAVSVSEGVGRALRTTAVGTTNQGVRQALVGLKAATNYVVRVRVKANGGDICNMQVDDGSTTEAVTSTTTGVYETLEAVHTTTGVPATVNIDLRSQGNGDICEWDYVTIQEKAPVVARPGPVVCFDTDNSTGAYTNPSTTWGDALVSCAVTPPGPNYRIEIRGQIVASNDTGQVSSLAGRIRENGTTTRGMATVYVAADDNSADHFQDVGTVPLFASIVSPTPGTTLTYTLEMLGSKGGTPTWRHNIGTDGGAEGLNGDSASLLTTLEVTLIPPN